MYATTRIRVKGRTTKPSPVRRTVVLYDAGRRLKSPDFGRGLLSSAMEINAAEERYNEILEQRFLESALLDRYTNGWL